MAPSSAIVMAGSMRDRIRSRLISGNEMAATRVGFPIFRRDAVGECGHRRIRADVAKSKHCGQCFFGSFGERGNKVRYISCSRTESALSHVVKDILASYDRVGA